MNCPKPFKNPKRTYQFWYYRLVLGGRVRLHEDVEAWNEEEARQILFARLKRLVHIDSMEVIA